MKKFFEKIKQLFAEWRNQYIMRIEAKREARLEAEAREVVQVMEFNRNLFVSVNGKPLFDIDIFKKSVADVVDNARKTYKKWKREELL